jgi:hypothetical protein
VLNDKHKQIHKDCIIIETVIEDSHIDTSLKSDILESVDRLKRQALVSLLVDELLEAVNKLRNSFIKKV